MTMGELSASIAHDVKQPLAAIVSNGQWVPAMLGRDEPDVGDGRAAVERVIRDSNPATRDEEGRGDRTALVCPFACRCRVKMSASGQVEMSAFGDVVSLGSRTNGPGVGQDDRNVIPRLVAVGAWMPPRPR